MRLPSKKEILNSKQAHWIRDFCNTNAMAKFIVMLMIWAVVSIPFDLYLILRWGIGPSGFWQELAFALVCIILMGWLQGLLLFFGIILSLMVLFEDM